MNHLLKNIQRLGFSLAVLLLSIGSSSAAGGDDIAGFGSQQGGGAFSGLLALLFALLVVVAMWKIFTKAGHPGWAAIIPIYNLYILCKIGGKPGWWVILFFIPFVNFVMAILLALAVARSFGKGAGFAIGMIFLPFIFYPILAFGSDSYQGPSASA